ncbi:MAG: LTA synthase family protein [Clostridia bacterium]
MKRQFPAWVTPIILVLTSCLTLFCVEFMQSSTLSIWSKNCAVNLAVYVAAALVLYAATRSTIVSTIVPSAFFIVLGTINHYMIMFREKPLLPWDLFAVTTAGKVVSGINFSIDTQIIVGIAGFLIISAIGIIFRRTLKLKFSRIGSLAIALVLVAFVYMNLSELRLESWYTVDAARENGMAANLIVNAKTLINPKPAGYSPDAVRAIVGDGATDGTRTPDIIVVMNESFADLSMIADLNTNQDVMPFVHSLKDTNSITGGARVSVFGGGTCNTEYDFLTGNQSATLRAGSYPMEQFVRDDTPSIAQTLHTRGYATTGIHPFYANGWSRDIAYPRFGFDRFLSVNDFKDPQIFREYISDRESYKKIREVLESGNDTPQFVFNITMQNHMGYDKKFSNFKEDITIPEAAKFPQAERYLSLAHESDRAISELVTYIKGRKRPTILLFFGDHLPAIEDGYYELLKERGKLSDAEFNAKKYTVPFFITANFDIPKREYAQVSASLLSGILLEAADAPRSSYQAYLAQMAKTNPLVSGTEEAQYHMVQYNQVFDKKHRIEDLFK